MKVPKHYLNRVVKLTWEDPRGGGDREMIATAPKGKAALAKWEEYGLIDDITDGVVRIRHSDAYSSPTDDKPDEAMFTWVVEELVKEIIVLVEWHPEREES